MNRFGRNSMHIACRDGDCEAVFNLIRMDSNSSMINAKDDHGFTPLYHASIFGHANIIKLLLDHRADIELADLGGLTPLIIASEKGNVDAVYCLLERGANIEARDSINRTALDWAKSKGHIQIIELLEQWRVTKHN